MRKPWPWGDRGLTDRRRGIGAAKVAALLKLSDDVIRCGEAP